MGSSALIGEEVNLNVRLPFQTSFRKTPFFHFAVTSVICVDLSHLNTPYSPEVCNIKCGKGQRMWMLGIYMRMCVCLFQSSHHADDLTLGSLHAAAFGLLAALTRKSPLWIIIRKPLCPVRASWCPSAGVFLFKEEYLHVRVWVTVWLALKVVVFSPISPSGGDFREKWLCLQFERKERGKDYPDEVTVLYRREGWRNNSRAPQQTAARTTIIKRKTD